MSLFILLFILAIIFELIVAKIYLKILEKNKKIQPLKKDGPNHQKKIGTPTMGGVSFVITIVFLSIISSLFISNKIYIYLCLVVFVGYALIGYKDDILKVTNKENDSGLSPKNKLLLQFFLASIIIIFLFIINFDLNINLFVFNLSINFSNIYIQFIIYFIFILLLMAGMSNATNLTDGLDGLLSVNYIISLIGLLVIAILQSDYPVIILITIIIGSLIGFLFYNKNPAKVFMGDTGSLSLGALLVVIAIILKVEVLLLLFGFIFILVTLSVVIQVLYFKYTKKKYGEGRRIFLMAPYHHHLEKKGYSENKIVILFASIQLIAVIIGIYIYIV